MKKYFNGADCIVFGVTILSLIWICFYKASWISKEPLFNNASIVAEIFYTVSTSIIASGLFYLFTIFIPKFYKINKMNRILKTYLKQTDRLLDIIIGQIQNSEDGKKYDKENFITNFVYNEDKVKEEFTIYYNNRMTDLYKIFGLFKDCFDTIYLNYSDLLPSNIKEQLSDFCNIQYNSLSLFKETDNGVQDCYFEHLGKIIFIATLLKELVNDKTIP